MNLQKHFNAKRFTNYLKYDISLNGKTYLFAIITLFIVLFVVDFYNINEFNNKMEFYEKNPDLISYNSNNQFFKTSYIPVFVGFLFFGLIISAGTSFSALRSSTNSATYLLLPTSVFEKYLSQFIIRVLVFVILYFILFWFTFKFAYHFYSLFVTVSETVNSYSILSPIQEITDSKIFFVLIPVIIMITLFAFTGAIYFKKYALFKSIFAFALTAISLFLFMVFLSHLFFDHTSNELFTIKAQSYLVTENIRDKEIYFSVLFTGISLIFLPLAYFKLKEREA